MKGTSGKGLHLVVPLSNRPRQAAVLAFVKAVARDLEARHPQRFVVNMAKTRRVGKIYLDVLRNDRGASAVAPCSPRTRPGAPVARTLAWRDLSADLFTQLLRVADLLRQGMPLSDPWRGYGRVQQKLPAVVDRDLHVKP